MLPLVALCLALGACADRVQTSEGLGTIYLSGCNPHVSGWQTCPILGFSDFWGLHCSVSHCPLGVCPQEFPTLPHVACPPMFHFVKDLFVCLCMFPACMYVYCMCAWCLWRSGEGIRRSGTEVMNNCGREVLHIRTIKWAGLRRLWMESLSSFLCLLVCGCHPSWSSCICDTFVSQLNP